jgi:hypothetical protein
MRIHNTKFFSPFPLFFYRNTKPVVDSDPVGSETFGRNRIRIRKKIIPYPGSPDLEPSFKVGSGAEKNHSGFTPLDQNPVISCSHKKMKYSTLTGSFSYDGINEFLRDLSYGKGRTNPVKGQPSSSVSLLKTV